MKKALFLFAALLPSSIKILLYRSMGAQIGKNVKFGLGSLLIFRDSLIIGNNVKIGSGSLIKCHAGEIGDYSEITPATLISVPKFKIGRDCKFSYGSIIRSGHTTKRSELIVGDLVHVFPFVMIDCSRKVTIQDGAGIGPKCSIFTHSSYKSILEGYSVAYADVLIGKRVELTYNVFVAPGVTIGDDAICAYGAYVNKDVEGGVLVAGMPAVPKRTKEQLTRHKSLLNIEQTIREILEDYKDNISFVNNREPLQVKIAFRQKGIVVDTNTAYILIESSIGSVNTERYAVFDITRGITNNHGIATPDYQGLRKYLSRYGIRFITGERA